MTVLIDEVFTEVAPQPTNIEKEQTRQSESTSEQEFESEVDLYDQIQHLQKRQFRLIAD